MRALELVSLELDEFAERIGEYFEKELGMSIKRFRPQRKNQDWYGKKGVCGEVSQALGQGDERKLVLYGNGSYHHFTYGLCRHADRFSQDYGYVHFDHHNDSYGPDSDSVNCASFVPSILADTNASKVLFIGAYSEPSDDYFPDKTSLRMTEEDLREEGGFEKLKSGLALLPRQVYMSFDLDVMPASLMRTGFNQGSLTVEELLKYIALIKQSKHIIGADVLGYKGYTGSEPGKEVYAEIVNSLLLGGIREK